MLDVQDLGVDFQSVFAEMIPIRGRAVDPMALVGHSDRAAIGTLYPFGGISASQNALDTTSSWRL